MLYATFQLMMGNIGRFLSQFYSEYARYINFVVLIYGISLIWAHNNLRVVIRSMEKGMVHFAKEEGQNFNVKEVYKKFSKSWVDHNKDKYIFIPSKMDLWFSKINSVDLLKVLKIDADYVKIALHKNIGEPVRSKFPDHIFLAWEDYRHNLVIGVRKKFVDPKEVKQKMEKKKNK